MSRVHDAMRHLEHKSAPEPRSSPALSNLVGALIEELADELPDDVHLETVRADLLAAGRSYESAKKKDLALRFYLTIRSLLREYTLVQERLKRAEAMKKPVAESGAVEPPPLGTEASHASESHMEHAAGNSHS